MKKRLVKFGVIAILMSLLLPISPALAADETAAPSTSHPDLTAAASVDGFLSIDVDSPAESQTVSFRAPLTGYYSLCLSEGAGETKLYISIADATAGVSVGAIEMRGADAMSDPVLYLTKGHDYEFTFSVSYKYGMTAALSLVRATTTCPASFTVEDGVLTGYSGKLVNIMIPEGVKSISEEGYADLARGTESAYDSRGCYVTGTSVTFPASMTEVSAEELNYYNMYKDSVAAVSYAVAEGSASFKSVDGVLYSKDGATLVAVPSLMRGSLVVPNGVKTIGAWAFAYGWLSEVTLPKTLVTVEESAFENAEVSEVTLPDSVKTVESRAFAYIGWSGSSSLNKVTLGDGIETIGNWAFSGMKDKTLVLPKSLKKVGMYAFEHCPNLTSVTIQSGVELGDSVFVGCKSLKTLNIDANVDLDGGFFENCPSLTDFKVGKAATNFSVNGGNLIERGTNLENEPATIIVLVPASSEAIDFTIPAGVDEVGYGALVNVADIGKLSVGKDCTDLGGAIRGNLTSISVASGNSRFLVRDGVLYSYHYQGTGYLGNEIYADDEYDLVRFPMGMSKKELVISDDVWYIWNYAFYNYSEETPRTLAKVTIPEYCSMGYRVFGTDCEEGEKKLTITGYRNSSAYTYYQDNASEEVLGWKGLVRTYNITFNANGGKIGTATTKKVSVNEGECLAQLPKPTRSGYSFQGWYDEKTGGDKISLKTTFDRDTTLYAHWKKCSYKVTFNGNGGTPSKKSANVSSGAKIGKLPSASRKGYLLKGWFTAKTGGTQVTANTKIIKAQTLYAQWLKADIKKVSIKVTGSSTWNGKQQKPDIKVTYGGVTLKKNTDYTVSYSNNIEPGSKAKVTIKGKGTFGSVAGTKSANFTIKKATPIITVSKGSHKYGTYKKSRAYMLSNAKQQDYLIYAANRKGKLVAIAPKVTLPSSSLKDKKKDTVKLSFSSANSKTAKIDSKTATQAKIKLVTPEETEITVKMAATKHYSAATYKFRVALQAKKSAQVIKLTSGKLTKGKNDSTFSLKGSYQQVSLGVSVKGKAKYTLGVKNVDPVGAFSNGGDKITAPFAGKAEVKVTTKATNVYPSNVKTFTINVTGFAAKTDSTGNWQYAQDSDGNIIILKYLGTAKDVKVPAFKVGLSTKTVSEIAERAFEGSKITSITFGAGKGMSGYGTLKKIGAAAFKNCTSLKTFIIPAGVTSIGDEAFYGCKSLTSLTLPEGVTKLGKASFRGCSGIAGVLDLPANMTSIGAEAFYGCSKIEQIHMHKKLATVGKDAFGGCSGLKKVYSERGVADWKKISMGSGNTALTGNAVTRYYNCGSGAAKGTMADATLFALNSRALLNNGYDEISDRLLANSLSAVAGVSFGQYAASYVKTATADIIGWPLRNFTEWALGGSWSEDALAKKVALELLETNMKDVENIDIHKDSSNDFKDKYDELRGYLKKIDGASSGLIYSSDDNRYQVAREINKLWGGSLEDMSRINNGLKKIGNNWDSTVSAYLKKTGKDLDAVEFLLSYLELTEIGYERVSELRDVVPEDSQLYSGLDQIQASLVHPFTDYAVHYLLDEALSLGTTAVQSMLEEGTQQVFNGRLKGSTYVAIASYFYKAISASMVDVPTMDDHYRAWFTVNNAMTLRNVADRYRADIIEAGGTSDEVLLGKFKTARIYYYAALKQTVPYAITSSKNGNPLAADLLQIEYDKYADALNLGGYLNSCKANAQGL